MVDAAVETATVSEKTVPQITREGTLSDIQSCFTSLEIGEELPEVVRAAWEEKNRLFDALSQEEAAKLGFHNEEHTNKTVTLLSQALIGYYKSGNPLSRERVEDLVSAAICHDLGYLKEEGGNVEVDLSADSDGHEERSKTWVAKILSGKAEEVQIARIQGDIDWTKFASKAQGVTVSEKPGLLLRFADLAAGGVSAGDEVAYEQMMDSLWAEMREGKAKAFQDPNHLKAQITANGHNFYEETVTEIEPLVKLVDLWAGGTSDLRKDIARAGWIARQFESRLTTQEELKDPQNLALLVRHISQRYQELVPVLLSARDGGEAVGRAQRAWREFCTFQDSLLPPAQEIYIEKNPADGQRIREITENAKHDLNVAVANLSAAFNGDEGFRLKYQYLLNPTILNFPGRVFERLSREIEGSQLEEFLRPEEVCREVTQFFTAYLAPRQARISFSNQWPQGTDPVRVRGDRLELEAAVFNVFRNSQKRITSGQGLAVECILGQDGKGGLLLEIKDDCGGFKEGLLTKTDTTQAAFLRGERAGEEAGSGFGLDITREVIEEEFGGRVSARNELDRKTGKMGAVVDFDFPRHLLISESSEEPSVYLARLIRETSAIYERTIVAPLREKPVDGSRFTESWDDWRLKNLEQLRRQVDWYLSGDFLDASEKRVFHQGMEDMGHDIAVIFLPIQRLLVAEDYSLLSPEIAAYAEKVMERFARKVEGRRVSEPIDVLKTCQNITDFFSAYFKVYPGTFEGAEIMAIPFRDALPLVSGDPIELELALFNLARNSQKRISKGEGKRIVFALDRGPEDQVIIKIIDDAGGFDEDLLGPATNGNGQVLPYQKAFMRGETGNHEGVTGQGFGLDIVRQTVEAMGGSVKAENQVFGQPSPQREEAVSPENMGAVITIELPTKVT